MIKDTVIKQIRASQKCKNRLALELNKSSSTIQRWLDNNSNHLTQFHAIQIIKAELHIEDIIDNELINSEK